MSIRRSGTPGSRSSLATVRNILETGRIRRREHFRTISVLCFPAPGVLASEALGPAQSKLEDLKKNLPPGYQLEIGGEQAKQVDGFLNLVVVLLISLVGIYLALLIQFNNAVNPLLVFAAAPYGAIGALIALAVMHTPFGFMAFLGVASLIGVIVSLKAEFDALYAEAGTRRRMMSVGAHDRIAGRRPARRCSNSSSSTLNPILALHSCVKMRLRALPWRPMTVREGIWV